jgi:hypothetical protein
MHHISLQVNNLTTIELRFVVQKGIFNWLCSLAQYGDRFSHCDAVSKEGTYIGAHLLGGVKEQNLRYDAGTFQKEVFVHLKATEKQEAAFFAFLRGHIGEPYDPIAIVYFFGVFSSRNWYDPGAWTCSRFIAEGLIACGVVPTNKTVPSSRLTPRDLYLLTSDLEAMASGGADV